MASRVYKAGTILSRTKSLLDAGVIKTPPLWLDVLEFLPPIRSPTHNCPPEPGTPPLITFSNDSNNSNLEEVNWSRSKAVTLFETHKKVLTEQPNNKNPEAIKVGVPKEVELKGEGLTELSTNEHTKKRRKGPPDEELTDELMQFLDALEQEKKMNESK